MTAGKIDEWAATIATALLGCERAPGIPALPADLAGLVPDELTGEQRLIAHAAVLSPWVLAGQRPPAGTARWSECSGDTDRSADSLREVLATGNEMLLTEWCTLAARFDRTVPHHLLPEFLDRLASDPGAESAIAMRRVIGARGSWLAQANAAWRSATIPARGDEPSAWESGTRSERGALLEQLRATDPPAARRLVEASLDTDPPEEVAAHVARLSIGLSMADHDFLERLLDARHKPVRVAAARLLACLPQSARSLRMAQRLDARFVHVPAEVRLLRNRPATIRVRMPDQEAPEEAKALARDGVEIARKRGRLGPKANTLLQIVAATPLDWFRSRHGAGIDDLIEAALGCEWSGALLIGWAEAALAQRDAMWAKSLLAALGDRASGIAEDLEPGTLAGLFGLLAPQEREQFMLGTFQARPQDVHSASVLGLLENASHRWSDDFSVRFLDCVRRHYADQTPWVLRGALGRLAARLSPACAEGLRDGWPTASGQWTQADDQMLDQLAATLELRRHYLRELSA